MKRMIMITFLVLLSACHSMPDVVKPASWILKQVPKDAPPNYKQGWLDGCRSGMGTMSNSFYKAFYQFTQDPKLRKDPLYYKTWKDTYTFCRHYLYGTLRQANVRLKLPNEPNAFQNNLFGAENILDHGLLNWWGPGTAQMVLDKWGKMDNSYLQTDSMGGVLDFSGDQFKLGNEAMNWDFRPKHSIFPY